MESDSKIVNIPKTNNPGLQRIRGALEHRATWMYLLLREAEKKGIPWEDIGRPAVWACGTMNGEVFTEQKGNTSLKVLKESLFTESVQEIFEMEFKEISDNELGIDFGFCPLVTAWKKLGCSDEEISLLCDIAMEGDRAIADCFGGRLELGQTIANGDKICEVRFFK